MNILIAKDFHTLRGDDVLRKYVARRLKMWPLNYSTFDVYEMQLSLILDVVEDTSLRNASSILMSLTSSTLNNSKTE